MAARIYALAKELNLDSKDLVDLVKKVGITGKGSALASLTDDEVQRVREHLSGASAPAKPAAPSATDEAKRAPVAVRQSVRTERRPLNIDAGARSGAPAPSEPAKPVRNDSKVRPEPKLRAPAPLPPVDDAPEAPEPTPAQTPDVRLPAGSRNRGGGLSGRVARSGGDGPKPTKPQRGSESGRPSGPPKSAPKSGGSSQPPQRKAPQSPSHNKPTSQPSAAPRSAKPQQPRSGQSQPPRQPQQPAAQQPQQPPRPAERAKMPLAAVRGNRLGGTGRVRSLDQRPATGNGDDQKGGDKPKRREPRISVNLASLPDAPKEVTPKSDDKVKAQKPDIKLSPDLIAGHKQGVKAPLDKLAAESAESKRGTTNAPASKRGGLSGFTDKGKRGRGGTEEEEGQRRKGLAGMARARADRGGRRGRGGSELSRYSREDGRGQRRTLQHRGTNTAAPRKEPVQIELPCTVRSFSEAASVPVAKVLKSMMTMGIMANINAELEFETAEIIAAELDLELQLKESETLEDELITEIEGQVDDPDSLVSRPPIVTFLGHVDHGKTSLLDYLIGINVVSGEAGGITQHIRAYTVDKDGRSVTFVDTPGHEAFTEMRARGANVTDIAVLVVAADDGIMPQTEEAISHAKAAGVPIVVALNKCDLEGVDPNRVLTQLTEHELTPSEWGGDVEVVRTSALTGEGMDELLEVLLTVAEMNEYSANPDRDALGVCLEAEQQGDRGVVAKMVVQNGTLRVGDIVVCGPTYGRVRAMSNTLTGESLTEAGPSTPISVMGMESPPGAGDRFHVLDDIADAREIAGQRAAASSRQSLSGTTTKVSFENFQSMLQEGRLGQSEEKVKLNVIIRADVKGSLEAIDKELSKFEHPEVEIKVLQRSVGGITLADVTLADASDAVVLGFNVIPDDQARSLADERKVEIRRYDVIYKLTDDIKAMIEGRLKPEERVVDLGQALVKQVFSISRVGTVAGCYVTAGSIQRGCRIRVYRDSRLIGDYGLDSLRRIKEDIKEVPRGMECGIRLQGFNDIKQDDILEAYRIEEVARTLD
ncbi:translation initiation factor IF-2 [Rhodopirellula sp. MGV]|uniref:translation initiation factor IF-2 n=1 Tax=Rhodopirellula sp. MGV TaxID=2023130 RepID=UPI000B977D97|nr:translation initiation factor IF-2 [Rhodopirellula sp. MGV]OYP35700.1 translation initiation factor IF-2 [Rhodopirellula sp. MGV]PNY34996.1 translation initiation factor IF-2 [Rhodopirellula baltica]